MTILKCDFCNKPFYTSIMGMGGIPFPKLKCPSCKLISEFLTALKQRCICYDGSQTERNVLKLIEELEKRLPDATG